MRFRYTAMGTWPPLAWLARCSVSSSTIQLLHGRQVETAPHWFCEAVWAGDFASGDFDQTEVVFGSGGRIREGGVTFVSAASTLDRLHSIRVGDAWWISNSLPCLLAALEAEVDPTYPDYTYDFRTVRRGFGRTRSKLDTSAGPVRLTYYRNLRFDGRGLQAIDKPAPVRDFSSFARYRAFLDAMLGLMADNSTDPTRHHRYDLIGTMSSGYDSPAVAVLARPHGLRQTFSFRDNWKGVEDSGAQVARRLGLDLTVIQRGLWKSKPLGPVPFLAADANGGDVDFAGAGALLAGRVLLSGHMGHQMWAHRHPGPHDHRLARKDHAGLSLSEYRLWAGFIHVPVPALGARQVRDVLALGRSPELAPWNVGGRYNRPIARRIVEEAGIPRGMFATSKKGVSLQLSHPGVFWSAAFADSYLDWLRERSDLWLRDGRVPPHVISALARPGRPVAKAAIRALDLLGGKLARRLGLRHALSRLAHREYLYLYAFPWAIERAKERYGTCTDRTRSRVERRSDDAFRLIAAGRT